MLATTAQVPKAVAIAADHVQVTASATDRGADERDERTIGRPCRLANGK